MNNRSETKKNTNSDIRKRVLKAGFWYTFSNFLVKGIAFVTMPVFTRIMTKTDIGLFSNTTTWFSILAIITSFEIYSSINIARFEYRKELDQYVSSTLILQTIITSSFYVLALILHEQLQSLLLINFQTLNILFIYLLVYPAIQSYQIRHQIDYDYKPIIKLSITNAVLSTSISLIAVVLSEEKLMARIYGYYIPSIIVSIIVFIKLLNKGKSYSKKYWKYALLVSFPLIWHLLAGYLLGAADKIMITRIVSAEANSLYSVAYMISQIASLLWSSMNNAWAPWAYKQMDEKKYNNLKVKSKPYTYLYLIIIFLMLLIAPELLRVMGGAEYVEAKYVMPPVMVGYIFQFVYSLYVNIEFYHKKQKNIAIGTIIAAAINILLNAIFIPKYGYIAAAYTTLAGYICLYVIHFVLVKKIGCSSWYDNSFFAKVLCASIVSIAAFNVLYAYNNIRYLAIIIAIIACITALFSKNGVIKKLRKKSNTDKNGE